MAALDDVASRNGIGDALRKILGIELWAWIALHEDDEVFSIRLFGIFTKTFRVKDLEPFATLLLGPKPA